MNITEEQKQEADSVLEIYAKKTKYKVGVIPNLCDWVMACNCAIQNRQSVLEDNKSVFEMLKIHGTERIKMPLLDRIQSLNNQISYLKSKI